MPVSYSLICRRKKSLGRQQSVKSPKRAMSKKEEEVEKAEKEKEQNKLIELEKSEVGKVKMFAMSNTNA